MQKIPVIFNPAAKGEKAQRLLDQIVALSPMVEIRMTRSPNHAQALAREAADEGHGVVVAAGGDGTINQVLNGIAGTEAALGILPVGTMNVFACELGLPTGNLAQAWQAIEAGKQREVDLAKANSRFFAQLAGVGLDAQVVQETDLEFRKHFGPLSYLVSATQIAARKPPEILMETNDGFRTSGSFLLIGNGRFYGGPFVIFNQAKLDDRLLDALVFHNLGYLDIMRYLQSIVMGKHADLHDVEYFQFSRLQVTSEEEVPVEIDGEVVGNLPVTFEVAEPRLRVLVP